jgi:plastocyanin domain-containing protein
MFRSFCFALFLALPLAACAPEPDNVNSYDGTEDAAQGGDATQTAPVGDENTAELGEDVQRIQITVDGEGYTPQRIVLREGIPAEVTFLRTQEDVGCSDTVQIPDFDVETTDLPVGEPITFTFTPDAAGEYAFACGMHMSEGTIVVEA